MRRTYILLMVAALGLPGLAQAGNITGTVTLADSPSDASGVLVELFEVAQLPTLGFYGAALILLLLSTLLFQQHRKRGAAVLAGLAVVSVGISFAFAATSVGTVVTGANGTFTFPNGNINREYILKCSKLCYVPVTVTFTTDGGGNADLEIDLGHPDIFTPTPGPGADPLPTLTFDCNRPDGPADCQNPNETFRAPSLCDAYPSSGGSALLFPGGGLQVKIQHCGALGFDGYGLGLSDAILNIPDTCEKQIYKPRITTSTVNPSGGHLVLSSHEIADVVGSFSSPSCGVSTNLFIRYCNELQTACDAVNITRTLDSYFPVTILQDSDFSVSVSGSGPITPNVDTVDIEASFPSDMPYYSIRVMAESLENGQDYELAAYFNNSGASQPTILSGWSGVDVNGNPLELGQYRITLEIVYHPVFGFETGKDYQYRVPANLSSAPTVTIDNTRVELYSVPFSADGGERLGCPVGCDDLSSADDIYVRIEGITTQTPIPNTTVVLRNSSNQPVTTPVVLTQANFSWDNPNEEAAAGPLKLVFGTYTPTPGPTYIPAPETLYQSGGSIHVDAGVLGSRQRFVQKCPSLTIQRAQVEPLGCLTNPGEDLMRRANGNAAKDFNVSVIWDIDAVFNWKVELTGSPFASMSSSSKSATGMGKEIHMVLPISGEALDSDGSFDVEVTLWPLGGSESNPIGQATTTKSICQGTQIIVNILNAADEPYRATDDWPTTLSRLEEMIPTIWAQCCKDIVFQYYELDNIDLGELPNFTANGTHFRLDDWRAAISDPTTTTDCEEYKYLSYDLLVANGVNVNYVNVILNDSDDWNVADTEFPMGDFINCNCKTSVCYLPGMIFLPVDPLSGEPQLTWPHILAHELTHYLLPGSNHTPELDSVSTVPDYPLNPSTFSYSQNHARCFTGDASCTKYQYTSRSTYPTPTPGCGGGCSHP